MIPVRGKVIVWILALILVGGGAAAALLHQAKQFSAAYAKQETQQTKLVASAKELEAQVHVLNEQLNEEQQAVRTLNAERDGYLEQVKQARDEQQGMEAVTSLHERVLKRTAQENRTLKERLLPLEHDYADLKDAHAALVLERTTLRKELNERANTPIEQKLKGELSKERSQTLDQAKALDQAKKELAAAKADEKKLRDELPKLEQKLGSLQDKYTKIMSENKTLAFKATHVPKEVTTLAREHERLLQDMADTHYNLGIVFAKKEDFVRAVKEFQKVIELRPADSDAHYNLGLIYAEHLPDRDKAMEYFARYLQINPKANDAGWVRQYIASWKAWDAKDNLE